MGSEMCIRDRPQKVGVPIADLMAGMYASLAITSALRSRELTGKGQYIDISMLDTHVAWLSIQAMNYLVSGENPQRLGNGHPNIVPYQTFKTADGHVILTIEVCSPSWRRWESEARSSGSMGLWNAKMSG